MELFRARRAAGVEPPSATDLAAEIKVLLARGAADEARDRFGEVVRLQQRRAARLAFHYLRDGADADEAVQDAFVKAFLHLSTFNEQLSFDVWFTRILVNSCLDRLKGRNRRAKWMVPMGEQFERDTRPAAGALESPETSLLRKERAQRLQAAIDRLPDRQRTVVLLSHLDGRTTREVSELTGIAESTVRVHLFRAVRKLRSALTNRAGH